MSRIVGESTKDTILRKLLAGVRMKQIAYEEDVSYPLVQKIKRAFPLLFWRTKKRYIPSRRSIYSSE